MFKLTTNLLNKSKKLNTVPLATFAKDLSFGTEGRNKMLAGCDKLADAV